MSELPSNPNRPRPAHLLIAALACALLTLAISAPWISKAPLAGTEGHRALTAHQMVEGGDWLVPHLYGRIYLRKPPLHYWIIATAESLTGRANEFIWRLPSPIMASLTAVVVALFGFSWFGKVGGWVAGIGFSGLVVLWMQSRSADIESTNTLFCTLTSLALFELFFNHPKRPLLWSLLAGAAFGATLLAKGPAGLPPIAGVLIYGLIKRRRETLRWPLLLSTLLGIALFAAWAIPCYLRVRSQGLLQDTSGLSEGIDNLYPNSAVRILRALLVPILLFVYSLPLSLGIPFALWRPLRRDDAEQTLALPAALAMSVLLSWAVCVASGMVNERYGAVTLPLLCPLAGGAVASLVRRRASQNNASDPTDPLSQAWRNLKITFDITTIGLALGCVVLCFVCKKGGATPWRIAPYIIAAVVLLGLAVRWRRSINCRVCILVGLLALLSAPFGIAMTQDRRRRSGYNAAQILKTLVPPGAPVTMGAMLRFQPELFYYANLNARSYAEAVRPPDQLPGDTWLVLSDDKAEKEYTTYVTAAGDRLGEVTPFRSNEKQAYLLHLLAAPAKAP